MSVRGYTMNKDDYTKRLRRIEGQVRGIERMIDDNWDGTMIHDGFFSYNTQFPEAVHQR